MAVVSEGKPTLDEVIAEFQAFRAYMARRDCENNRSQAALECTSSAMHARLQLEMDIIRANFAGRPLDPEYIRTRRDQIDEREKVCHAKVEQRYQTCMRAAGGLSPVRARRGKR